MNVSRAVTRLKSIFVNFDKVADPADVEMEDVDAEDQLVREEKGDDPDW